VERLQGVWNALLGALSLSSLGHQAYVCRVGNTKQIEKTLSEINLALEGMSELGFWKGDAIDFWVDQLVTI